MSDFFSRLDAKIDACETEIDRISNEGAKSIVELRANKAVLMKAKAMLAANPEAEALLTQLKTLGVW